jgi:hypothetical protein
VSMAITYSVCLRTERPGELGSIPNRGDRMFPLTSVSRPALGPTQPAVQWVPGVLSLGLKRGRDVTLTTRPNLVPKSRMSRSCTPSPPSTFMVCSGTALADGYCYCYVINRGDWFWVTPPRFITRHVVIYLALIFPVHSNV